MTLALIDEPFTEAGAPKKTDQVHPLEHLEGQVGVKYECRSAVQLKTQPSPWGRWCVGRWMRVSRAAANMCANNQVQR